MIKKYLTKRNIIKTIGALLLLIGIFFIFIAPLEMYCYYLFTNGGKYAYEGFGFGSFMFSNITIQIIGYFLLGIIFATLGYGYLKLKSWVITLTKALLWMWLIVGLPCIIFFLFILLATKELSVFLIITIIVLLLLAYFVIPFIIFSLLKNEKMIKLFIKSNTLIEKTPFLNLVTCLMLAFIIIILHLLILFNGMFPGIGEFIYGLNGIILLDVVIICLYFAIYAIFHLKKWPWLLSMVVVGIFTFLLMVDFCNTDYLTILSNLNLPPKEIEILEGIPVQGYHFAILFGIPLIFTWILIFSSKIKLGKK